MNRLEAMQLPFNPCGKCGGAPHVDVRSNQNMGITLAVVQCDCGNTNHATFTELDEATMTVHPIVCLQREWNEKNPIKAGPSPEATAEMLTTNVAHAYATFVSGLQMFGALFHNRPGITEEMITEVHNFVHSGSDDIRGLAMRLIALSKEVK